MRVKDLLRIRAEDLVTVKPDNYVYEAVQLLAEFKIGLLLVLENTGELAGVISERDIIGALANRLTDFDYQTVGERMTKSVVTIEPQTSVIGAVKLMSEHGIRHLVAMEDNKPVGIFSIRDALQAFASDLIKNGNNTGSHPTKEFVKALAAYQNTDRLSFQV